MATSTLTNKGQTTIPKQVRDHLHLKSGDRIEFVIAGDTVTLRPATRRVEDLKGFLPKPTKAVTLTGMDAAIRRRACR